MVERDLGTKCNITAAWAMPGKQVETAFEVTREAFEGFAPPGRLSRSTHRPIFSTQRLQTEIKAPDGGGLFVLLRGDTQQVEDRLPIPIPVAGSLFTKSHEERFLHGLLVQIEAM
jgi:Flp pilus assembly secretin CpaC